MTARRLAVVVLALLAVGGCGGSGGQANRTLIGPRLSIEPGAQVEVPFRLDAPGRSEAELRAEIEVVSDGPQPAPEVEVRLIAEAGEVTADPSDATTVQCTGNCRGEHQLALSLPAQAAHPVTVTWTITARVATDGSWHGDQMTLESGSLPTTSGWSIVLDTRKSGSLAVGGAARLHLSGPRQSSGALRLEFPVSGPPQTPGRYATVVNDGAHQPFLGSSLQLSPPESCDRDACDWSVIVASVVPWQVAATSNEFDASVTPLEGGMLAGGAEWRTMVEAGERVPLTVVVSGPSMQLAAGVSIELQPILWSVSPFEPDSDPVVITVGTQQLSLNRRTPIQTPRFLIPLECDSQTCQTELPILIDTNQRKASTDIGLRVRARMAGPPPAEGEVRVEIKP